MRKLDKQIEKIINNIGATGYQEFNQKYGAVSQIKQSILKAIMEEGEKLKTNKYKDLWNGDYCKWCDTERGNEHLGACDFIIEENRNSTISKFESVIKEILK